ncbi:MAG: hypothetical protein H6725_07020 [Sandaracinaceae bacterium]|nr:hypothetical protein [Sandaracinaceae bacterium]
MTRTRTNTSTASLGPRALLATLLGLAALASGCGSPAPPGPGTDGGFPDGGFRDGGTRDMGGDGSTVLRDGSVDGSPADAEPSDSATPGDGGDPADGGNAGSDAATDASTADAGTDLGPPGATPRIVNVAWTVAQDGSCGPGSGLLFTVVVTDDDTDAFFLTPTVTGMGSCFFFGSTSATEMVDITLTNCPHDQAYTPTVTLRDPEGHVAAVSGFTVQPCTNGAHFP